MSDAQVIDELRGSRSQSSDSGLPPHPAYFRHHDDISDGMNGLNAHQELGTLGRSSARRSSLGEVGGGHYAGNSTLIHPEATGRASSPAASPSRQDSYDELTDGLNRMAFNNSNSSYVDQSGADSMVYQQSAPPIHEAYAYGADTSSNSHRQQESARIWPAASQDYASPYLLQGLYDPYIAAASNVLGDAPPSDEPLGYHSNQPSSLPDQFTLQPSMTVNTATTSNGFLSHPASSFPPSSDEQAASDEFAFPDDASITFSDGQDSQRNNPRPSLHRSGTTGSVNLGTRKMKAVDLSAPPYTKEFIDEYRQRIKNDPDPETHFRYARYLIDAARNIGAKAADQRAVRKYRELLVQEALKVFRRLATQGEPYAEAQFFLANCYGTGMLGLQVDHERAYHLYLQAAKQNHAAAAYRVAVCNEIGAGTRKEPPRAFAFYRKAASLGDTAAMYKLGMILLSGGLGQPPNPREAVAWLRRAAEQADEDNPHALYELGLLYENSESKIVPYDPVYAKNLYTKAAQLGYTQAQFKLGQCYEYGTLTCPVDARRSIGWYTKAAEKGNAEAELALSGWYLTGSDGVLKQSDSEAYLWARRAANRGLSTAEYAVGYFSEIGIGVKQDIELAKRWYMRAAAQGNKRAMNRLTELKRMGNKRGLAIRPTRQQAKDECVIC